MAYSLDDDYSRDDASGGTDNLFGWTIFILLLIGLAFACWLGSFHIFGHPENPRSYAILKKLGKIDPPKRFELTKAPPGEFLSPKKLYDRYATYSNLELQRENDQLLRNYLRNYGETKKLVPYVIGKFEVLDSFELQDTDLIENGVVALAQPTDFPNILIEHIFPATGGNISAARANLVTGADLELQKSLDLSAVIHIEKIYDGRLLFTVMPLLYGSYAPKQGTGGFSLEPPTDINLAAGAPVLESEILQEGFRAFADYRRQLKGRVASTEQQAAVEPTQDQPELVRIETMPTPEPVVAQVTPEPTLEDIPVARAVPVDTPLPTFTPTPTQVAMNQPPAPTPTAAPQAASPEGVPLQPFITTTHTPSPRTLGAGSWRVYPPGAVPSGRVVDVQKVRSGAYASPGERVYLKGDFVVTASGDNRAVLRARSATRAARVIVSFPSGSRPPAEGSSVVRNDSRPFEVTDVREGADGLTNIYVREITVP